MRSDRKSRRAAGLLPSPGIQFGSDFLARVGALAVRLNTARERREGAGKAHLYGVGAEFVGYRPYRPGEDPRQLDWGLYARLRRPFVRVARREASESWTVLLDTSASMGVGTPGKLQRAAEVATGIAAVGVYGGARVQLLSSESDASVLRMRRASDLVGWMAALEKKEARDDRGLGVLSLEPARLRGAGRVFVLGDFLDLEPAHVLRFARRGRELFCAQLLAPEERTPDRFLQGEARGGAPGAVEWVDAETGERETLAVDRGTRTAYESLLASSLEAWGAACARHRTAYGCWSSTTDFEDIVQGLLGG